MREGRYQPIQVQKHKGPQGWKPIASPTDDRELAESMAEGHYVAGRCEAAAVLDRETGEMVWQKL